jgi:hypothetical protein
MSAKQLEVDKLTIINKNYEPKLREANRRIADLEREVADLRNTVIHQENVKIEN